MKISKATIKVKCKVCQVETPPTIKCGALVCEACKRFYLRNRSNHSMLKCRNGHCLEIQDSNKVEMMPKGVVWRHMCAACRFKKCLQVGMDGTGDQASSLQSSSCSTVETHDNNNNNNNNKKGCNQPQQQMDANAIEIMRLVEICHSLEPQQLLDFISFCSLVNNHQD